MKRSAPIAAFTCICFLLLTISVDAAPPVEGFLGVPWGSGMPQAKQAMAEKGHPLFRPVYCVEMPNDYRCAPNILWFQGLYAGNQADLMFEFHQNQLVKGSATLGSYDFNLNYQMSVYNNLTAALTDKYGTPAKVESNEYPHGGGGVMAIWLLTAGKSGDQVEIRLMAEKAFVRGKMQSGSPYGQPGLINVIYTNTGMVQRLKMNSI
jgi:hypothetical protein